MLRRSMGKLPYPFPLHTSKENRGLGAGWQNEKDYSPCLFSLADWVAETYFITVEREKNL